MLKESTRKKKSSRIFIIVLCSLSLLFHVNYLNMQVLCSLSPTPSSRQPIHPSLRASRCFNPIFIVKVIISHLLRSTRTNNIPLNIVKLMFSPFFSSFFLPLTRHFFQFRWNIVVVVSFKMFFIPAFLTMENLHILFLPWLFFLSHNRDRQNESMSSSSHTSRISHSNVNYTRTALALNPFALLCLCMNFFAHRVCH